MKKLFSLGLLPIFLISSMPTTSAAIGEKVVDEIEHRILIASLENPPQEEAPAETQSEPEEPNHPDLSEVTFTVVSPYMDKYEISEKEIASRVYSSPRIIQHKENGISVMTEDFSYFQYLNEDQPQIDRGYSYILGDSSNGFTRIKSLNLSTDGYKINQIPLGHAGETEFKDNTYTTTYQDIYPNIDLEFKDKGKNRYKSFTIKERPEYLQAQDYLNFEEEIILPEPGKVTVRGEEESLKPGTHDITGKTITIQVAEGELINITPTIMFDANSKTDQEIDLNAVATKQEITIQEDNQTILFKTKVSSDYLLNPERTYPVTVDPKYEYCKNNLFYKDGTTLSTACDMYDIYFRGPNETPNFTDGNEWLYAGRYINPQGTNFIRIPKIFFAGVDHMLPPRDRITSARLFLHKYGNGLGAHSSNIQMQAFSSSGWGNDSTTTINNALSIRRTGGTTTVYKNSNIKYSWDITDIAKDWIYQSHNYAVGIKGVSSTYTNWSDGLYQFYSEEKSTTKMPYIEYVETLPTTKPNLITTNINPVSTPIQPGTHDFDITIKNTGQGDVTNDFYIGTFLRDPNASMTLSGYHKVTGGINAGQTRTIRVTETIDPAKFPNLNLRYTAEVDYGNYISETDETDNRRTENYTVAPSQPDLKFQQYSLSKSEIDPGGYLWMFSTVENQGQATSPATTVRFYISTSPSLSGATYLDTASVPSLPAGDTEYLARSVYLPTNLSSGIHYIIYVVDENDSISESDENNNIATKQISVGGTTDPEIGMSGNLLILDTDVKKPDDILNIRVDNLYNQNTQAIVKNNRHIVILVEEATNNEFPLTNLNPYNINLDAGENKSNFVFQGKIPNTINNSGSYKIRVIVDFQNNYNEQNESDNSKDSINTVTILKPVDPSAQVHPGQGTSSSPYIYDEDTNEYYLAPTDMVTGTVAQDPVNFRNGQFYLTSTDFVLDGRGHNIDFSRTYNSRNAGLNSRFGNGWSHTYNSYLHENEDGSINLFKGGALASNLTSDDGTKYYAQGSQDVLVKVADGYEYQSFSGDKFYFNDSTKVSDGLYMISSTKDQNGNKTKFQYLDREGIKLINKIEDPSGRILDITYGDESNSAMWDKITKIQTNIPGEHTLQVDYEYTIQGDLTLLTKSTEHRTFANEATEFIVKQYEYDSNGFLTTYTDPRGTKTINQYDLDGRTIKQFYHDPSIHTTGQSDVVYDYAYEQTVASVPNATCTVSNSYATDTEKQILTMCFDADGQKVAEINGSNSITRYEYNTNGLITKVTDPNGNSILTTYNEKLQVTSITYPEVNGRTLVKTYTYNNQNKPLTITETETDSNNNQTVRTFTNEYDANGNLTKEINPLGDSSTYEYDQYGNLTQTKDKRGNITKFYYTSDHNYISNTQQPYTTTIDGRNKSSNNTYEYDNFGNITKHYNPRAYPTTSKYDSHGNVRENYNRIGAKTTYKYDLEHNLTQEINHLGYTTEYEYQTDLHENLAKVTQKAKVSSTDAVINTKEFNRLGQVTKEIDPNGNEMTYTYNNRGLITQSKTPTKTINYTYDANGNLTSEQIQGGLKVEYLYDALNRQYKTRRYKTNTNYQETSIIQDSYGNTLESIAANGAKTTFTYDLNHRLTSETNDLQQTTNYAYDQNGNLVGITLPRSLSDTSLVNDDGYSISYHYNQLNHKIKEIDRDNNVTVYEYDDAGNLITTIQNTDLQLSQNEQTTNYHYNALNLNDQITYADGTKTTLYYDALGRLYAQLNDEGEREFINVYDHLDRVTKVMNDNGYYLAQNEYDKNSNLIKQTLPNNQVTTSIYDAENRLVSMTDGEGNTTTYEYNVNDFNTKINKPNNQFQVFEYDLLGNIIEEINSQNIQTIYAYNDLNQLTQTNYGSTVTKFEYDSIGQLVSQTDPTKDTTGTEKYTFQYDEEGNLTQVVDPINGEQDPLVFTYDKLNRLTSKKSSDIDQTFQYDRHSRLTSSANPDFELQYTYNNINQITQEDHIFKQGGTPITRTLKRDYNTDGTLKTLTYPSTHQVQYEYTNTNQLSTVKIGSTHLATYNYTNDQILTNTTYSNGVSTNYVYDKNNQVKEINTSSTISKFLPRSQTYTYDENLNTSQINNNGVLTTNQFDVLDQLKSSQIGDNTYTYNYNQYGDRTASTITTPTSTQTNSYTYDPKTQQLVTLTETTGQDTVTTDFSYDKIGNLTTEVETNSTNQITKNYQLNRLGYLEQIHQITKNLSTNNTTETNSTYTYDNNGNRVSKTTDTETTYYLNDGLNVLAELRADGTRKMQRIYGLGVIAELSRYGTLYFLNEDRQQTLTLTTSRNGELGQELNYGPFGELAEANQQTPSNSLVHKTDYQYTGQEYDPESGLHYYNARYYNAKLGRFIQRDTYLGQFGNSLTRNRYSYVNNNPYKYVDPTGNVGQYGLDQSENIIESWIGSFIYTKGLVKEKYATFTNDQELLEEAWLDISGGYEIIDSSVISIGETYNEFSDKEWSDIWEEDKQLLHDIGEGIIDSFEIPVAHAPDMNYSPYNDKEDKIEGSIIGTTDHGNPTHNYDVNVDISGQNIGLMIGLINPFGKDKKAKKIYGEISDTIKDTYKKNKGKIDDILDYFKKNRKSKPGYKPNSNFENREGLLPSVDSKGNNIIYTEHDIDPLPTKGGRNADRIVTGSDGKTYYTDNHYNSFIEITER